MNAMHIKERWHKISPTHGISWEMRHMIHDRIFWFILAMLGFVMLMTVPVAFGIWSGHPGSTGGEEFYRYTF